MLTLCFCFFCFFRFSNQITEPTLLSFHFFFVILIVLLALNRVVRLPLLLALSLLYVEHGVGGDVLCRTSDVLHGTLLPAFCLACGIGSASDDMKAAIRFSARGTISI